MRSRDGNSGVPAAVRPISLIATDRTAARAIVRCHRAEDLGRAGDRARLDERRRAEHSVAVERGESSAIGANRPQALDRDGRAIGAVMASGDVRFNVVVLPEVPEVFRR